MHRTIRRSTYDDIPAIMPVMIAPIPKTLAVINIVLLPITTTFAEDGLYQSMCGL